MSTLTPKSRLPIGWSHARTTNRAIGFTSRAAQLSREMICYDGEGHLLTIAPTGAGKGRCGLIPALLTYPGPTLTIDLKGENYRVTARARRQMGHKVVVLDPFRVVVPDGDRLNPFDLFGLPGSESDHDSEWLADILTGGQPISSRDVFWELTAKGLLTGLIGLVGECPDSDRRNLGAVLDLLYSDDPDYAIAVQMDTHKFKNQLARQELAGYLQHESERCRPSVRSTAQAIVKCLGSCAVRTALSKTTFDLGAWVRGEPMDIYFVFPPDRMESHRALLRLWIGTLLTLLLRREVAPARRTLLLLDEVAQLGTLPQLRLALTLLRGYGVQVWTFWQDLSQLKHLYPTDWETIVNNSAVAQVFGLANGWAARTTAELLGCRPAELVELSADEQMLLLAGAPAMPFGRIDYLTDQVFAGLADPNPRYLTNPVASCAK